MLVFDWTSTDRVTKLRPVDGEVVANGITNDCPTAAELFRLRLQTGLLASSELGEVICANCGEYSAESQVTL